MQKANSLTIMFATTKNCLLPLEHMFWQHNKHLRLDRYLHQQIYSMLVWIFLENVDFIKSKYAFKIYSSKCNNFLFGCYLIGFDNFFII